MPKAQLGTVVQHLRSMVGTHATVAATDGQLLARFAACQEESAFATLLRRHGPMVLRIARGVLGQEQDAEDVFQATFLLLARKAGSIRKPESASSWLHGVAYHLAVKARARRARRQAHERQAAEMRQIEPKLDKGWCQVQAIIDEEIERLPEKYRTVLVLCYLESKSETEVSAQLGCPVGTVRSRVARGREQLRKRLAQRGLSLSTMLAVATLAAEDVSATVSAKLTTSTIKAALEFAAGESVQGVVSVQVATLVKGGQSMFLTKAKTATVLFLALGLTATGAGSWAWRAIAKSPVLPQNRVQELPSADSKQAAVPNDAPKPQSKDKPAQGEKAVQEHRNPKSYKCQVRYVVRDQQGKEESDELSSGMTEIRYWSASGALRQDVCSDGKVVKINLDFPDKPGIKIDHKEKSFWKTEPFRRTSPENRIEKFMNYRSEADRKLPAEKIDGKHVEGFEIAVRKIDPDDKRQGNVRVWYDPDTMRPLKIERMHPLKIGTEQKKGETKWIVTRFDHFKWDVPTEDWFKVAASKGYKEIKTTPLDVDEQTRLIVKGLEAYKKHFGRYPQVEMVYPDLCSDEIDAKQGEPINQDTPDSRAAVEGFGEMMGLQRHNVDCAYYGKTVGPNDKDRILFRWRLDGGDYRVIYGDLHTETLGTKPTPKRGKP